MLDYALNVTSPIVFVPLSNNTIDLPSSLTENRFARIEKYIGGVTVSVIARDRNTYVNTYTSGSWTGWDTYTTKTDFVGEYTASIMLSSNQSNGYSISTMIPLPGADAYTITPVSLRLLDGSSQVTSGIEIDRKNKAGFSVSYYGTAFQGVGAYLVFRASK